MSTFPNTFEQQHFQLIEYKKWGNVIFNNITILPYFSMTVSKAKVRCKKIKGY